MNRREIGNLQLGFSRTCTDGLKARPRNWAYSDADPVIVCTAAAVAVDVSAVLLMWLLPPQRFLLLQLLTIRVCTKP